jgi:hypothetical protein
VAGCRDIVEVIARRSSVEKGGAIPTDLVYFVERDEAPVAVASKHVTDPTGFRRVFADPIEAFFVTIDEGLGPLSV